MAMQIDRPASAGTPGQARLDGVVGEEVTLIDTSPGGSSYFELYFVPDADTSSVGSLAVDPTDDHRWTFTQDSEGPFRIYHRHTEPGGSVFEQILIYGVPDADGFVPPAPGERAPSNVRMANATNPEIIARCERNVPTARWPLGQPWGYAGAVGAGGAGGTPRFPMVLLDDSNDGDTLEVGFSYYTQNTVEITLYLPLAAPNDGALFRLTNGSTVADVVVIPTAPEHAFDVDTSTEYTATDYGRLPPARQHWYEFFSLGDGLGIGYWGRRRFNAPTRKCIDVRWLALEPLPAYSITGTFFPRFTADVDGELLVDGSTVSVGDLIAVPFNPSYGCVVRVVDIGSVSSPWIVECESTVNGGNFEICATLVRVTDGNWGREREFYIGPGTRERRAPLLYTSTVYSSNIVAYPGKIVLLDMGGDAIIDLKSISAAAQEGMEFGVKVDTAPSGDLFITPTLGSVQIEDPATGIPGTTVTIASAARGLCSLWRYDAAADIWRVATHG